MSTADKLLYLQDTKGAIKDAIVSKGVEVPIGTTFREYANKIGNISGGGTPPIAEPWVRPTEWLALPDNVNGVQKVSILKAVFDTDSEFIAMIFEGDYTIDWGDGVIENLTSGVKAEHKYEYSNVNLNSDTVTKFGYKQCVITITPQLGHNLTNINLNSYHSVIGSSVASFLATGFLDLRINSLSCNILHISRDPGNLTPYVTHAMLEQCLIGEIVCTTASHMFNSCFLLQSVSLFDLSACTNVSNMFSSCYVLQSVPLFDLSSCTNASNMFNACYALQSVSFSDLSACTNVSLMFTNCRSLQSVSLFDLSACTNASAMFSNCFLLELVSFSDLSACTNASGMFNSCFSLESVPLFDLSACTDASAMFTNCCSLQSAPLFDLSACTNASNMFSNCYLLQLVPLFDLSSCTNALSMFNSCFSLQSVPLFDLSACTNVSNMFSSCYVLQLVPLFDLSACTNASNMFTNCRSLQSVPLFDLSACTNVSNMFSSCRSLKRVLAQIKVSFSIANAKMGPTALNEMYSILPTVTGQTITVTGNYGVSGDNPAIATAKGWIVTG